jgi:hypothetical protein
MASLLQRCAILLASSCAVAQTLQDLVAPFDVDLVQIDAIIRDAATPGSSLIVMHEAAKRGGNVRHPESGDGEKR